MGGIEISSIVFFVQSLKELLLDAVKKLKTHKTVKKMPGFAIHFATELKFPELDSSLKYKLTIVGR